MCDIWQQKKGHEITPLELKTILKDPLFSEVRGVGINGGEPTLRKDLPDLAYELCNSIPKLRHISLITNGLNPKLIKPRVKELYSITKKAGVKLDIMLSLDGVGEVHDRVRGRHGNFAAVEDCLNYFRSNNIGDSYRIGCTLIAENIEDAERLMLWAENQKIYCRFRIGIPHQRLYTKNKVEPFSITDRQKFHLCNFLDTLISRYEKDNPKRRLFLQNLRNQIAYALPRANGCLWKDEGVTLLSDGGFAYCAVESPTLGSLSNFNNSASKLYYQNQSIREEILLNKCKGCLHDYEGKITPFKDMLNVRTQQIFKKFNLPIKPLNAISFSIKLGFNSYKLLPKYRNTKKNNIKSLSKNRILIVGWYGTETLGDKAILYSIISELINVGLGSHQIVVASIEPYITEFTLKEFKPVSECSVISLSKAELMAKDGQFNQVIFGGGPIMSSIGYLCNIASIFKIVKKSGGQTIIWGCGLGPIRNLRRDFLNKLAIKQILRTADQCVFRDKKSLEIAKELAGNSIEKNSNIALDPAFHWVKSHARKIEKSCNIGFAIRSLPISEYFTDLNGDPSQLTKNFNSVILTLMQQHAEKDSVYLQCMHRLPCGGDDRLYYLDLLGDNIKKFDFSIEHRSPLEDISALSGLNRLYGMRFHSVVFAIALGIPVIPIDYTNGGKINSLCKLLDIRCWSPLEIVDQFKNGDELPIPQLVEPELLDYYANKSISHYKLLAEKIKCFMDE